MSMTRNEILIALADGREMEVKPSNDTWIECRQRDKRATFDEIVQWIDRQISSGVDYRIKRTPREWWFNIYKSGIGMPWQSSDTSFEARDISKDFIERVHVREVLE